MSLSWGDYSCVISSNLSHPLCSSVSSPVTWVILEFENLLWNFNWLFFFLNKPSLSFVSKQMNWLANGKTTENWNIIGDPSFTLFGNKTGLYFNSKSSSFVFNLLPAKHIQFSCDSRLPTVSHPSPFPWGSDFPPCVLSMSAQ